MRKTTRGIPATPPVHRATTHRAAPAPTQRSSRVHRGDPASTSLGAWMFDEDATPETERDDGAPEDQSAPVDVGKTGDF